MATLIQGFGARLANRPFLLFDVWALWRSGLSAKKSKSKNARLSSLASNLLVTVLILELWAKMGLIFPVRLDKGE